MEVFGLVDMYCFCLFVVKINDLVSFSQSKHYFSQ